jgi:hypothetical protein
MIKTVISIILIGLGIYILMFWGAGMHGNIRFRPHMLQDWILGLMVAICFSIPIYFLIKRKK